jgi:glycosyltransferase involved in cell wall biosynthesis
MAEVSVIIPTFNRALKVARAVTSVLYQNFTDYEIIVVDDGSSDETAETLGRFCYRVTRLTHAKNRGVSAARNTGIKASRSPFIAFLDSDDYWLPNKLKDQMAFFESHPEAVACQTQELWIRNGRRVNPRNKHLKAGGVIFEASLRLCLVSPSSVMVRRFLFDEVGLFDETFPVCEDYDLWLRISCKYPIHLIDRNLVIKEGGAPDQLSRSVKGMDRFRIRSLVRLIKSGQLDGKQAEAALSALSVKTEIYGRGCLKRGKKRLADHYLLLPGRLEAKLKTSS